MLIRGYFSVIEARSSDLHYEARASCVILVVIFMYIFVE